MKSFIHVLIIVFIGFIIIGCHINGEYPGNVESEERNLTGFDSIDVDGSLETRIFPAEDFKVVVTTGVNYMDNIETRVKDKTLHIDIDGNFFQGSVTKKVDVYLPELKSVNKDGSGNMKIVSGNASDFSIEKDGSGNIDAVNYQVENVSIDSNGSGNVKVWATKTLSGKRDGSGNVLYKGNPQKNITSNGSGKVKPL